MLNLRKEWKQRVYEQHMWGQKLRLGMLYVTALFIAHQDLEAETILIHHQCLPCQTSRVFTPGMLRKGHPASLRTAGKEAKWAGPTCVQNIVAEAAWVRKYEKRRDRNQTMTLRRSLGRQAVRIRDGRNSLRVMYSEVLRHSRCCKLGSLLFRYILHKLFANHSRETRHLLTTRHGFIWPYRQSNNRIMH